MKPYDIDPFFAQILPENSTAVRAKLKAQIATDGKCRDAFVVGIIDDQKEKPPLVDGMTRDRLIDELRAEGKTIEDPKIISRHFGSRYEAVAWMFSNEGSRRTLTPAQRALALLRNKEEIERLKTEAQARKGKKLGENAPRGRVNDSIAVAAHVSDWTVKQIRKVSEGRVERQMSLCMFP